MSKANVIRKKALGLARKQDWAGAIKEYKRLAGSDSSNPIVFNELGDIYLKSGNKVDAYESFVKAIDAYTQVSLHNNAVAVCKKVLRVIPARFDVLVKLGSIRASQGLSREAESFFKSYLEKATMESNIDAERLAASATAIVEELPNSAVILQYTADCLLKHNLKDQAGEVLLQVLPLHQRAGDTASATQAMESLQALGLGDRIPEAVTPDDSSAEGPVITEDNLWTQAHSDGERIEVDSRPQTQTGDTVAFGDGAEASEEDYAYGDLDATDAAPTQTAVVTPEPPEEDFEDVLADFDIPAEDDTEETDEYGVPEPDAEPVAPAASEDVVSDTSYDEVIEEVAAAASADEVDGEEEHGEEIPAYARDDGDTQAASPIPGDADSIHVSMIIDEVDGESANGITEEDYRSHYDMGMAFIEMQLYEEALREYQFASKSPQYALKSVEMIGLCFLRQGQATLAVKQLVKGLQLIGDDDVAGLGIRYNLGLAYELAGDAEKAKGQFEEVYLIDVTFRDVAEKITKDS
ncbi:MAG: tetratricopeptide repeat protein [Candidatus Krumholzibacteriota bacterium]|nr:tetratricopeptide repeat protein [Candidatus Krumholzibacteriota bacterium]